MAGPAIAFPMLLAECREVLSTHLRAIGEDEHGLTNYRLTGTVSDLDEVGPLLLHQHEHDHVGLYNGTPTGVLLSKLHQFPGSRLLYLMNTLAFQFGARTLALRPPFLEWFTRFADAQPSADRFWSDWKAFIEEMLSYQRAEAALLGNPSDDPGAAVSALNAALHSIAGFQSVAHPGPQITPGDERLLAEAGRWQLTGESIFEAHALLTEGLVLAALRPPTEVIERWHARRYWSLGENPQPISPGVRVLDVFLACEQQGAPHFTPEQQRLLVDLALLAPIEPATWAAEELPFDAVHPALRLLRLFEHCMNEGPLDVEEVTVRDVDAVFARLAWPSLSELVQRVQTQEPIGITSLESAVQMAKVGVAPKHPRDPLRSTQESLRVGLEMRRDDPAVFACLRRRFPMPAPIEYFTDEAWLKGGYTDDADARHERLVISLVAAWLLNGRPSDFKTAVHVHTSMLGFLHRSRQARPDDPDVEIASPEMILRHAFHAEVPELRALV